MRLAGQLNASPYYRVVERSEWSRLLDGAEINQNCRLHPAWALQIGNWIRTDAVVTGRVNESDSGRMTIATAMFQATGVVLARASGSTVEAVSAKLSCRSLVNTIRIRSRLIRGRVTVQGGELIVVDVGASSGLKAGDFLQVHRILDASSEPCGCAGVTDVMVGIGTAKVLETGSFASLGCYTGTVPARRGDFVTRLEFLSCPSGFRAVDKRRR